MIVVFLIGVFVGVLVGVFLLGLMTAAKRGAEPDKDFDPYDFHQRQERVDRALMREGITHLGRVRVGIDTRYRKPTIADDIRMDRQMDADRSEY